jgi:hypothetical protein
MFLRDITVIFCHSTCHLYSFKGCSSDAICGPFAAKTHQSSLPSFIPTVSCAALVMETFIAHFNRTVQQHSAITFKRIFCTYAQYFVWFSLRSSPVTARTTHCISFIFFLLSFATVAKLPSYFNYNILHK